jgi:hypothetical protein
MFIRIFVCAVILAMYSSAYAQNDYRLNTPPVLQPKILPDQNKQVTKKFSALYKRKGSPRMVVLWDRQYSDKTATNWQEQERVDVLKESSNSGNNLTTSESGGKSTLSETSYDDAESSKVSIVSGKIRQNLTPTEDRRTLNESSTWQLESAFSTTLSEAGVRLIDRDVLLRNKSLGINSKTPNLQALETQALQNAASILIQVLVTADDTSATGLLFNIKVKNIKTGQMLASVTSDGSSQQQTEGSYQATSTGFEKVAPPAPTLGEGGRNLATQMMQALENSW